MIQPASYTRCTVRGEGEGVGGGGEGERGRVAVTHVLTRLQCYSIQPTDHAAAPQWQEGGEVDVALVFAHGGGHPREVRQSKDTPLTGIIPLGEWRAVGEERGGSGSEVRRGEETEGREDE